MGRTVSISPGRQSAAQSHHSLHASDHLRAALSQHAVGVENRYRAVACPILVSRRFLAALLARLYHERGRLGLLDRSCRTLFLNRVGHSPLSQLGLAAIQ